MIDAYSAIRDSFFVEAYDERGINCEIVEIDTSKILCSLQDSPFKLEEYVKDADQELLSSPQKLLRGIIDELDLANGFHYSIFVVDTKSNRVTYLNSEDTLLMIKDIDGEIVELESNKLEIDTYPLSNISTLFTSNSALADTLYKKSYKDAFCKKDILKVIKDLNEELLYIDRFSFVFLNNQIGKNIDAKANYDIEAKIDAIAKTEESVELFLESYFRGNFQNARTLLVVNELLMNAYEHGVLKVDPETKNRHMTKGSYDEYLERLEKLSSGRVTLDVILYKNGVLQISIDDYGEGFDEESASLDKNIEYRGRGISLSKKITDALFYEKSGAKSVFFINYKLKKNSPEPPANLSVDDILQSTSLLYVEDDPIIGSIIERALLKNIGTLYVAKNGSEGLEIFKEKRPDIVISDLNMPVLNGLDMSKSIRQIDKDVPILITTGMDGDENIADAINANVNKFLQKPIDFKTVKEEIEHYATLVYLRKNAQMVSADDEIRSKASYMEEQERQAYTKQQLITHNDSHLLVDGAGEVYHKPMEILSGDMYGVYKISDKKTLLFVADCMGKGLVASVTSVLAAAFLDRALEVSKDRNNFDLDRTCKDFVDFIQKYLLDEETISFSIILLDGLQGEIRYISYGMYPALLVDFESQSSIHLKSTNPPLLKGENGYKIESLKMPVSFRVVVFSDGACDFEGFDFKELLKELSLLPKDSSPIEWYKEFISSKKSRLNDDVTLLSFTSI